MKLASIITDDNGNQVNIDALVSQYNQFMQAATDTLKQIQEYNDTATANNIAVDATVTAILTDQTAKPVQPSQQLNS